MSRLKNDDTLTKLGDIYHYLLVLKYSLELKPNEKIYVEQYGDISKKGKNDTFQTEVKHHVKEKNLTDRDSEIWNSIKNWIENRNEITDFKELILLTTSSITDTSSFYEWEEKDTEEKLRILKQIGSEKKKKEEGFRSLYDKIFAFEEEEIKVIISKFKICPSNKNVSFLKEELKNHPHFLNVDTAIFDAYLDSILGYIIRLPTRLPYNWEISYVDFKSMTINLRDKFSKENQTIPNVYSNKETSDTDKYIDRNFVKEIKLIRYDEVIPDAINDVWRTNNTIIDYFNDNYVFYDDFTAYKDELRKKLNIIKRNYKLDYESEIEKVRLKQSKKFFNEAMLMNLEAFGMIKNNSRFFQNGSIHELAENQATFWYIEGEK